MRALTWDGVRLQVAERPDPVCSEGMAVVEVGVAGVCNTDVEIVRGYMNFRGVIGHELVGTVREGPSAWRGKRVVAEINFACGRCAVCARGLGRHCATRTVMGILGADGAMAEQVAVPVANLHAVPDGVPDEAAVFAEPLAAAFEILEQVHVRPRTRALVLGDGKLGLLCAQVLHQAGASVLAVGRHEDKLALLRARGIETVLASDWAGDPAELVVEATGSAEGFAAAVRATLPRGTLILKSTVASRPEVDLAPLVVNEITVVGSRCGSFEPALRALSSGSVEVLPLVSARVPLDRADEALRVAQQPGVLKVLVTR
ncbi:alcohol dehydrogenase [Chondromyces crocatus]|uniref:Alcohol dehydrogenase n=2 Tax=Chondromyces crocatus TaxID=52 RepID=A0A0K1EMB5_CHOCO|nr:alcohol dehydrogenase [Chondromyces crocatus]